MIRFLWKKGFLNDLFAFLLSSSVSCVSVDAFSQNSKRPTSQLRRHLKIDVETFDVAKTPDHRRLNKAGRRRAKYPTTN
jgi:hypothetical protein